MTLPRSKLLRCFLPAILLLLASAGSAFAAPDKRMQDYFDCIDRYAGPAIRNLVAEQGLLADSQIAAEVAKAETRCPKQTADAVLAVHQTPKNGTEGMTDDQIRDRLRTLSIAGYILTYGQK
jgi:hypothetical protein